MSTALYTSCCVAAVLPSPLVPADPRFYRMVGASPSPVNQTCTAAEFVTLSSVAAGDGGYILAVFGDLRSQFLILVMLRRFLLKT